MCVRYKGEESSFQDCPGGGPQGGLITGILFILQTNKAGASCVPQQEKTGDTQETRPRLEEDLNYSHWMENEMDNFSQLEVEENNSSRMEGEDLNSCLVEVEKDTANNLEAGIESPSRPEVISEDAQKLEVDKKSSTGMEAQNESQNELELWKDSSCWMEDESISTRNQEVVRPPPCTVKEKLHKKSFVDDLTLLERISLKDLEKKNTIIGPLNYHN